jgi:mannose-6-phosphate isomerase
MANLKGRILTLAPNRVWRPYLGGRILDQLAGNSSPTDSHFGEDWIASLTRAVNAGREQIDEGVSAVIVDGRRIPLPEVLATDAAYFLGARHVEAYGPKLMFLVKFLDSAIRLPIQTHPTIAFAQKHLGSNSGKTEVYHVLSIRPEHPSPYLFLGFQHPPSQEEFRRMVETQDHAGLEGCFEKIPVKTGDTFYIPGGIPHALGAGVLMVEIMEPTDYSVRFDYQKPEYGITEAGRFMNRDLEFAMSMTSFDYLSVDEVLTRYRIAPVAEKVSGSTAYRESLINEKQTKVLAVKKAIVQGSAVFADDAFSVSIVTKGTCEIETVGGRTCYEQFDRFLIPAGVSPYRVVSEKGVELLQCYPPGPA